MINEPVTPDPTIPASEPATAAYPAYDPWSAVPPADTPPVTAEFSAPTAPLPAPTALPAAPFPAPPAAPFPAPPAAPFPAPPAAPFPAPPAAHFPAPPAAHDAPTARFSAPPVPFSSPPVPFSSPPAPFPVPPAQFSAPPALARPGPRPPVAAPAMLPAGQQPARPAVVAVQIGEIVVTPPVIHTPAGVLPLAGASWQVADFWQQEEKIATWALVCAIVGFFCLTFFSLFFLLVKETRYHGTVQVTVVNGGHHYVARIPVLDQGQVQHINNQVNYARSLSTF
ncbi:hypothetical protein ABZ807_05410 [Micromonospora sp. NPDC047548]|uniref:hypothetical protein n=1 Tax=Micromonospora sp. NPDC047548 TaxID=3155624 RepID=UPI0033F78376